MNVDVLGFCMRNNYYEENLELKKSTHLDSKSSKFYKNYVSIYDFMFISSLEETVM